MASVKVLKANKILAKLADKQAPCAFCQRMVDEETTYGKLYRIGDIYCHYFCVLLSCCLIQKGKDEDGLFGFLYPDILAEIERSKKHKCSYCYREGATLGCSVSQCRKQFHLPCGREKQAVSLFYGNFKTFCKDHAPKQKIPDAIMSKAKLRKSMEKKVKREKTTQSLKNYKKHESNENDNHQDLQSVCVICYEAVEGFPTNQTFWPPCCARDAWFHRSCLERMALSAGVHYLKCPLCNDKDNFYEAVLSQGYYIPDRDAAWELDQNAFSDIYERPTVCTVEDCKCPNGREYDADTGEWAVAQCVLCGGGGAHGACAAGPRLCAACAPAAPARAALALLARVPLPSQSNSTQRHRSGPIMPSRMSLRRTKGRQLNTSSTSQSNAVKTEKNDITNPTDLSRDELNLKPPKRRATELPPLQDVENKLSSPLKLLKRDLYEKILNDTSMLDQSVLAEVHDRFKRPKPLVEKKKIVNEILERFVNNISKEKTKIKEPIKEWNSPKKISDKENVIEIPNDIDTKIMNTIANIKTEMDTNNPQETLESKTMEIFNEISKNKVLNQDDDSNSTFQLPSEFIADYNSDHSLPIFDTPKKLKKINIENDSMEISTNDQIINIDLVKIENEGSLKNVSLPDKSEKCALKFSTIDKEVLDQNNVDMDVESFKNQYLNEVRQFNCNFKHKHNENSSSTSKLRTPIDFAIDSLKKPPKRKSSKDSVAMKRRKTTKMVENVDVIDKVEVKKRKMKKIKRKSKKNHKNELSIRNKNINLKIKWKNEELKVKITKPKKKKSKKGSPVLKQYVLKYFENNAQDGVIGRPENDVAPVKKQVMKTEKTPDNLKQTSIDSFFKARPFVLNNKE